MHSVLRSGTQLADLPHAALHFDPVPSLSSDSDVGDLTVDPVASNGPIRVQSLPSGFVCRVCALLCDHSGEDCVVLAGYELSACAVPLQGLAPVLPGSTSLAQPLDATLSIACSFASPWMSLELPPLQYMLFPPASVFGPEALRKGSWVSQSGRQKLLLRTG